MFLEIGESPLMGHSEKHIAPLVLGGLIAAGASLAGNAIGSSTQSATNKTSIAINRQNNQFNAEQAQIQRDWQEKMWNKYNEYNSPDAMISRGLNPFIDSAGAGVSKSPASGGAVASASPPPSLQAFRPDFSNVGSALASMAQAQAAMVNAENNSKLIPYTIDQLRGATNYKNIGVGESGYWNKETGRISAELDQSMERQQLENAVAAGKLSAAQTTQIYLQADAQAILNKYMDVQQQADLFTKCQYLHSLEQQGALTEKQIKTEVQRAILISAQAQGQKISNKTARGTADALISATNMAYYTQYYDSLWDYKNVNIRKNMQYSKDKATRDYYKWSAANSKKDFESYGLRNAIDYSSRIFQGVGNIIGAMRPGAQIFRNGYGPRNGSNGISY